jgi:FtsP/CotA-like multicopper oxidase with cupredoxin domain
MNRRITFSTFATTVALTAGLLLSACGGSEPPASTSASASASAPSSAAAIPAGPQEFASQDNRLAVTLTAAESQVPYEGSTRWAMTYNGTATGPTLRVHPGDTLEVTLVNKLSEPTSLHTHGLHVSPDGNGDNPFVTVEPGGSRTYTYEIPADHQAGTFWYHPHAHGMAAEQVAAGLSGAIIVADDVDTALAAVSTDRVLVINDPPLSQDNPQGTGSDMGSGMSMDMGSGMDMGGSSGPDMMTRMMGRTGPRLLTNGENGIDLSGSDGKLERAHIVNATASTRLLLTWTGATMMRLAAEGGRLPSAQAVDSIELAPGERTEVILVPSASGGELMAQRLSNEGIGGATGLPETIARIGAGAGTDIAAIPARLTSSDRDLFAADVVVAEQRVISLDGHMQPTIDGKVFDPNTVNFTARKGTVEEWVIRNNTPMFHPIHLHAWPFQVKGEQGWQDVVTVAPESEQVVRVAFDDFGGTTVIHCHILDHEDTGMMAIVKVE